MWLPLLIIKEDCNDFKVILHIYISSSYGSLPGLGASTAYILGILIYRDRTMRLIGLSQTRYIERVLKRFNMKDFKRGYLPFRHGIHLSRDMCCKTQQEKEHISRIPCASIIGSLIYAMLCTKPDIAYAVSVVRRY